MSVGTERSHIIRGGVGIGVGFGCHVIISKQTSYTNDLSTRCGGITLAQVKRGAPCVRRKVVRERDSGRRRVWITGLGLLVVAWVTGCADEPEITTSSDVGWDETALIERWNPARFPSLLGDTLDNCPDVDACEAIDDPGSTGKLCMCELEGILVNAEDPPSDTAPSWPDPPGWYPYVDPNPGGGGPGGECEWGCPVPATPRLVCSTNIERGGNATCTVSVESDNAYLEHVYRWVFQPDFGGTPIVKQPGGSDTWSGTIVTSGDVRVVIRVGGSDIVLASRIRVTPRSWSWANRRTFQQGSPPDLDNCLATGTGLTADVHGCSSGNPGVLINPGPNQGFTISSVSGGPNDGLWYVTNPTTRMDLRTQVARKYRTDAIQDTVAGVSQVVLACTSVYAPNPVPTQNNHGVNTVCLPTADFSSFVSFAWSHEGQHLVAAQQEAQEGFNDIYTSWEPIVRRTQWEAFSDANDVQNDMHSNVASASNATHTGGSTPFSFWYHVGSGIWDWATITVVH